MNLDQAIGLGRLLFDLGARVFHAIAKGDYERVERILPTTLRTSLAKAQADDEAEEHFARQRAMLAGGAGEGQP